MTHEKQLRLNEPRTSFFRYLIEKVEAPNFTPQRLPGNTFNGSFLQKVWWACWTIKCHNPLVERFSRGIFLPLANPRWAEACVSAVAGSKLIDYSLYNLRVVPVFIIHLAKARVSTELRWESCSLKFSTLPLTSTKRRLLNVLSCRSTWSITYFTYHIYTYICNWLTFLAFCRGNKGSKTWGALLLLCIRLPLQGREVHLTTQCLSALSKSIM